MLIFVMLIAHTVADFIIQPRDVVKNKSSMKFIGYLNHGLGLVLTLIPLILFIKFSSIISVAYRICIIIVIHLLVDFIKERIQNHFRDYEYAKIINLILFTCDQLINIIVIILLTGRTSIEFNGLNEFFLEFIFVQGGFTYQDLKYIFIILYISFSGAYFVPLLFDIVYRGVDDYAGSLNEIIKKEYEIKYHGFLNEVKAGKWIGIMERILIVGFLHLNQLPSIGFIIAVKSLARFKMMENKIFSEYYLLGTLFSIVYTFITYVFLKKII